MWGFNNVDDHGALEVYNPVIVLDSINHVNHKEEEQLQVNLDQHVDSCPYWVGKQNLNTLVIIILTHLKILGNFQVELSL